MAFLFHVFDHVSTDLRIRAKKDEETLREQEKVWKATNEDLVKRVEILIKEKVEKEEEHDEKIMEVIAEVNANTDVDVWEAKIKLDGCRTTLAKLKGEPVNTSEDPEGQQSKMNEEEKTSGNDDQATV